MIALASGLGMDPVPATAIGAACGAVTNFTLGRTWIFNARAGSLGGQAARYAVTSATSLGLNTLGEWLLHGVLGVPYVAARAVVAIVVSLGWNFPMQRWFVFAGAFRRGGS
jgi:putative flippase GtrA